MLDTIRYMIVWFPVIFLVISLMAKSFPHHHVIRHIPTSFQGAGARGSNGSFYAGGGGGGHYATAGAPSAYLRRSVPPPMPIDTVDVGAIAAGAR